MAKKNKRATQAAPVVASIPAARTEFNPDYTYVKKDLTRIGILVWHNLCCAHRTFPFRKLNIYLFC